MDELYHTSIPLIQRRARIESKPHTMIWNAIYTHTYNINNNNNNNHVYGAVIMTTAIARVHPVHLMNADWAPGGRQPSEQANLFWLWVRQQMAATVHILHHHLSLLLSPKADTGTHFTVPHRVEGRVNLNTAEGHAARAHRSGCRDKHNCPCLSHCRHSCHH